MLESVQLLQQIQIRLCCDIDKVDQRLCLLLLKTKLYVHFRQRYNRIWLILFYKINISVNDSPLIIRCFAGKLCALKCLDNRSMDLSVTG